MRTRVKSEVVYISGPISGTSDAEDRFGKAAEWLKNDGHKVLNPMDIPNPPKNLDETQAIWVYYMREAIKMLVDADCIYMMEDWDTSAGSRLEFNLATNLEIPIHYAENDDRYV